MEEDIDKDLKSLIYIIEMHHISSKPIQDLLDLYNKEKEKNKKLEEKSKLTMELIGANYITKDKIKEKIEGKIAYCRAEELEDSYIGDKHSQYWGMYRELLEKLEQELLEERN